MNGVDHFETDHTNVWNMTGGLPIASNTHAPGLMSRVYLFQTFFGARSGSLYRPLFAIIIPMILKDQTLYSLEII